MTENNSESHNNRPTTDHESTTPPAFTETLQIGIVVRDLDATVQRYLAYGIGPWSFLEITPDDFENQHEYGQPVANSSRVAYTKIGGVDWELIQPLNDDSLFTRFLNEHGEGVHHIALGVSNYDEILAMEAKRGKQLFLSGDYSGIRIAYLDSQHDLGVPLEIADFSNYKPKPDPTES